MSSGTQVEESVDNSARMWKNANVSTSASQGAASRYERASSNINLKRAKIGASSISPQQQQDQNTAPGRFFFVKACKRTW